MHDVRGTIIPAQEVKHIDEPTRSIIAAMVI